MQDALDWPEPHQRPPHPTPWQRPLPYQGPERRRAQLSLAGLLSQVLDEIDYGVLLLADARQVLHVNHAARAELGEQHPLQLLGSELRARLAQDVAPLHEAVQAAATRGLRRLLVLGSADSRVEVSVVPLGSPGLGQLVAGAVQGALLVLGRRRVCGTLTLQGFARAHALSGGEEQVLRALCEGLTPQEVATRHGVKIATIRTQIASIRAKTGAETIRELVQQVALLPPLVETLRPGSGLPRRPWPDAA